MSKKQQSVPGRRGRTDETVAARATPADLESRYNFRRNRTLTGSLSSNVASVNEHRAELKSARVHSHHLRRHRRHAGLALLAVLAVSAGLFFLISQAIVTVTLKSSSATYDGLAAYQQKVQEYLAKHPFEHFRFLLNTAALADYLQAHDAPEVASFGGTIDTAGFGNAVLYVTFRTPVVAWQTAGAKMYVDATGNSFQRNNGAEPSVQVVDQTGIQAQNNQVLASNRFLGFIGKVIGRMKENNYTVTQIVLPANTTRQVELRLEGVAYPVKFSVDRPVGEQAEDAARAIKYLHDKNITAEYIDVRVSGKAYYR